MELLIRTLFRNGFRRGILGGNRPWLVAVFIVALAGILLFKEKVGPYVVAGLVLGILSSHSEIINALNLLSMSNRSSRKEFFCHRGHRV